MAELHITLAKNFKHVHSTCTHAHMHTHTTVVHLVPMENMATLTTVLKVAGRVMEMGVEMGRGLVATARAAIANSLDTME